MEKDIEEQIKKELKAELLPELNAEIKRMINQISSDKSEEDALSPKNGGRRESVNYLQREMTKWFLESENRQYRSEKKNR